MENNSERIAIPKHLAAKVAAISGVVFAGFFTSTIIMNEPGACQDRRAADCEGAAYGALLSFGGSISIVGLGSILTLAAIDAERQNRRDNPAVSSETV